MKRVFCCLTAAVVLFGAVGCAAIVAPVVPDEIAPDAAVTQAPDDTSIVFDDPALEASIRETLGKPQGDITKATSQRRMRKHSPSWSSHSRA